MRAHVDGVGAQVRSAGMCDGVAMYWCQHGCLGVRAGEQRWSRSWGFVGCTCMGNLEGVQGATWTHQRHVVHAA